jgi:hypothetical protein
MTLTTEQLVAIAPRVLSFKPCECGCPTCRINPALVEAPTGQVLEVKCTACERVNTFSAAELGLVPAAAKLSEETS